MDFPSNFNAVAFSEFAASSGVAFGNQSLRHLRWSFVQGVTHGVVPPTKVESRNGGAVV